LTALTYQWFSHLGNASKVTMTLLPLGRCCYRLVVAVQPSSTTQSSVTCSIGFHTAAHTHTQSSVELEIHMSTMSHSRRGTITKAVGG